MLSPTREPREVLEQLQRTMGSYDFAAQYQQRPAPKGGGLIKWAWFRTYDQPPIKQRGDRIVQSWDKALFGRVSAAEAKTARRLLVFRSLLIRQRALLVPPRSA